MAHVALFRIATMSPSAADLAMVCSAVQSRVIKTACIASVVSHSLLGSLTLVDLCFYALCFTYGMGVDTCFPCRYLLNQVWCTPRS